MPLNHCIGETQLLLRKYSVHSKARENLPFATDKPSKVYPKNYSSFFPPVSTVLCTKFRRIYTYIVLHST